MAQAGAHIVLVHRSPQTPTTTLDGLKAQGYGASVIYADLSDKEQTRSLFSNALTKIRGETGDEKRGIQILVHAAGIQRRAPAAEFKDDEWEEVRYFASLREVKLACD